MSATNNRPDRHALRRWRWAALALLIAVVGTPFGAPETRAANVDLQANCNVILRPVPSTAGTAVATLPTGSVITWTDMVIGNGWSATCGSLVAGSTWYAISAIDGQPVYTLFGTPLVYAATGLFRVVDGPEFLEGVDVSRWQGAIDFAALQAAGKRFVIAKATEGIGFTDPMYWTNRFGATSAGLAVTAYHFARPDLNPANPQAEADWFVDSMGLVPGMLLPALDLEVAGTLGTTDLQVWVQTWLDRVYARTGARPMIYASPAFWKKYLGDTTAFADQGYSILWVAHWSVAGPTIFANNWSNRGWAFWQYSNCGSVPGIAGCIDLDRYNGGDLSPMTYGADFALSSFPETTTASVGTATTFTLNFSRTFVTTPIDLSVSGLPAGATAVLSASPVLDSSATLTVTSSLSGTLTPSGTFPLTITALSAGLTRTATVTLVLVDPAPPVVTAPVYRLVYPAKLGPTIPVQIVWSAVDPDGISAYGVQRQVAGAPSLDLVLPSATSTSINDSVPFGTTFGYAARATDGAGNVSEWTPGLSSAVVLTEQASSSIVYSGTWTTLKTTKASGGSLRYATRSGASATYGFTGSGAAWVAYRGPNRGSAKIYVDGVYKRTVSLYAPTYTAKQIVYAFNWGTNGPHKIKIVVLGTVGHPLIDVDAFIRLTIK